MMPGSRHSAPRQKRTFEAGGFCVEEAIDGEAFSLAAEPSMPSITAPSKGRKPRTDTKQAQLFAMPRKPEGASVDEIVSGVPIEDTSAADLDFGGLRRRPSRGVA